jgi:hypothetical protein
MKLIPLLPLAFVYLAACDAPTPPTAPTSNAMSAPVALAPANRQTESLRAEGGAMVHYACGTVAEDVWVTYVWHIVVTSEVYPEGGFYQKHHINLQHAEGVGLTTGDRYIVQLNELQESSLVFDPLLRIFERDTRNRLIRPGSDDNAWLRSTSRFTFPPGTTEVIRAEVECRG